MLLHQIIAVKLKGQFTQKFKFALSFLNFRPYKMEVTLFLEWNSKVDFWLKPWFLVIHKMQASGCMIIPVAPDDNSGLMKQNDRSVQKTEYYLQH